MGTLNTEGISLYYEALGKPEHPPVLLLSGLGGVGQSWGPQIERFAERYHVLLPDQRGTGQSTRAQQGYTTEQLAADMAALVRHLELGPVHVVGSSTGGAIAQHMALDHPETVRSLVLSSTFARFDAFAQREFAVRRRIAAEWDRPAMFAAYALFLFCPRYTREHPERVAAWIERAAGHPERPGDRDIALQRIDMIAAHDALARLREIRQPTLVLCGDLNLCTPLPLSEEIARAIPGAELVVLPDAGELIELEKPDHFFDAVRTFIAKHHAEEALREDGDLQPNPGERFVPGQAQPGSPAGNPPGDAVVSRSIEIPSSDGTGAFTLHIAEPARKPCAVILVIQEIYGVNTDIRHKCERLARQGYLAVAPDLFWRLEPGVALDPYDAATWDRAMALARRFDTEAGVRDIQTTIDEVKKFAGRDTKIGLIGYSLGGRLAALAVARTKIDAAVGYYGVRIQIMLGEADKISRPLMLHIASLDKYVDQDAQAQLHRALDDHPLVTLHDYTDQHHDFAYGSGTLRAREAATLADQRTMSFLEAKLGLTAPRR